MQVNQSFARAVLLSATCVMLALLLRAESYFGQLLKGWDAQFYYAAARSMVYDGDLDVTNDLPMSPAQWVFQADDRPTLPRTPSGMVQNKYPVGTSLAEAGPLWLSRLLTGDAANGYAPFQIRLVGLWLVMLSGTGLWVTWKWLQHTGNDFGLQALSVVLVLFGTSQLYYSAVFPFLAHGISALLVASCLLTAERARATPIRLRVVLAWGLLSVLLILTRPQQATLVAVLGAALLWEHRRRATAVAWIAALGAIALLAAALIQCLVNLHAIGEFRFSAYAAGGEGFDILSPDFSTVLIGAARGWFFLAPITLVAVPGVLLSAPRSAVTAAATAHLLLQIFMTAAWSSPDQGDSFGARMLVDVSPILALGLHEVLVRVRGRTALATVGAVLLACVTWTTLALGVYTKRGIPVGSTHRGVLTSARDLIGSSLPR